MEDDEGEQVCRICRVNDPDLTLCRPCKCSGSIGLVCDFFYLSIAFCCFDI